MIRPWLSQDIAGIVFLFRFSASTYFQTDFLFFPFIWPCCPDGEGKDFFAIDFLSSSWCRELRSRAMKPMIKQQPDNDSTIVYS